MFKKLKRRQITYIFSQVAGCAAADLVADMLTAYIDSGGFNTGNKLVKTFGKLVLTSVIATDIERKINELLNLKFDADVFGLRDPETGDRIY